MHFIILKYSHSQLQLSFFRTLNIFSILAISPIQSTINPKSFKKI